MTYLYDLDIFQIFMYLIYSKTAGNNVVTDYVLLLSLCSTFSKF